MDGLKFEWDRRKVTANGKSMALLSQKQRPHITMKTRELLLTQTTPKGKIALSSWA